MSNTRIGRPLSKIAEIIRKFPVHVSSSFSDRKTKIQQQTELDCFSQRSKFTLKDSNSANVYPRFQFSIGPSQRQKAGWPVQSSTTASSFVPRWRFPNNGRRPVQTLDADLPQAKRAKSPFPSRLFHHRKLCHKVMHSQRELFCHGLA